MIVYRVEASTGDSFVTQWEPRLDMARSTVRDLKDAGYKDPHIDKIELGTSREAVVRAMNHAHVSRVNWDGEQIQ